MKTRHLMIALFLSVAVLFLCQTGLAYPLFNASFDFEAGTGPYSVAIGDLDGDGNLDLAVANVCSSYICGGIGTVSVLLGNGDSTIRSAVNYGAGYGPCSVAIGDLDGDGDLDLAVANDRSDNVSVLLGNGDGTFQSAVNYGAGYGPYSVAVGDLDGDGNLDMAIANCGFCDFFDCYGGTTVSVLLGNGDGTFRSAVNYGAGEYPNSVAIGDLDGDGVLDLAVANSDNVSVLLGNGDGTFQSAVNYGAGNYSLSVAIGDLNGDGDLDLAVANGDGTVSVLLGNGDGSFQTAVNYGAGDGLCSVAIGDLDGDGVLDLAVANDRSDNVSVFLGNGDGTFQSPVNHEAGDRPLSVALGDLDGDGDLDLAVANKYGSIVSVLLSNGDGTFQSVVNYVTGRSLFYRKGWSMISLPVDPTDKRLNKLFPDAVVVYRYEKGTGYVRVKPDEDLEVGTGYWILLNEEKSYTFTGHPIPSYTYPVSSDGWYMIGGCSSLAQVSSNNCNIGMIYRYVQGVGYQQVLASEYLEPNEGYWILFSNTSEGAAFKASTSVEIGDLDDDGVPDRLESCPNDPNKTEPGGCGCGVPDIDSDGDGVLDCNDGCPNDPNKIDTGACGCGIPETDSDTDGTPDCIDGCPNDPDKVDPGYCGCWMPEIDADGNGVIDCMEEEVCPNDPYKTYPGGCGCGVPDIDSDGDGTLDCNDECPNDPNKVDPGICGCGVADTDSDGDGTLDCD